MGPMQVHGAASDTMLAHNGIFEILNITHSSSIPNFDTGLFSA